MTSTAATPFLRPFVNRENWMNVIAFIVNGTAIGEGGTTEPSVRAGNAMTACRVCPSHDVVRRVVRVFAIVPFRKIKDTGVHRSVLIALCSELRKPF